MNTRAFNSWLLERGFLQARHLRICIQQYSFRYDAVLSYEFPAHCICMDNRMP